MSILLHPEKRVITLKKEGMTEEDEMKEWKGGKEQIQE